MICSKLPGGPDGQILGGDFLIFLIFLILLIFLIFLNRNTCVFTVKLRLGSQINAAWPRPMQRNVCVFTVLGIWTSKNLNVLDLRTRKTVKTHMF